MSHGPTAGPRDSTTGFDRLVVGFDGSPSSARAARFALELGRRAGARLWLVHAHQPNPQLAEPLTEEEADSPARAIARTMERIVREAGAVGVRAEAVSREGPAAEVLLALSREVGAGAIVVGTRGLGGAARLFLGSVSSKVVAEATVPVTVVP